MAAFRAPGNPPNTDSLSEIIRWLINQAEIVRLMLTGKLNATGSITLTANSATTTLTDARLGIDSFIDFDPMTAHAAADRAAGEPYVLTANRTNGVFTLTHSNTADTDRTFKYLIIG